MAYMKKHCSGCCSGCNNGYAQVNCNNKSCSNRGCGCSTCNHHHGCNSCSSCGCNSYGRGRSNYGALRSVTGPFSNCGNWWNNDDSFPYYTGPCGSCEPCRNCCCRDWPWPWPVMPVNVSGYMDYPGHSIPVYRGCDCRDAADYTSHKNHYHTEAFARDVCASHKVKPIVDCGSCRHRCDDDC